MYKEKRERRRCNNINRANGVEGNRKETETNV